MTKKRSASLLFAVLIMIFLPPTLSPKQLKEGQIPTPDKIEGELWDLINKERVSRSLGTLSADEKLAQVAKGHSMKMSREKTLSHTFPEYDNLETRLKQAGVYFMSFAENVAFSETYVASIIHQELMDSPLHRENIVDPEYTHCGINVVKAGENYYVTQNFARLFSPRAVEEVETDIKQSLSLWFQDEKGYPLTFFPEMKETARLASKSKLMGANIRDYVATVPPKWGSFWLHSLLSPELDRIKTEIKKKIGEIMVRGACIGVAFGRNDDYPGGTYAVAAFLFGNEYQNLSSLELSLLVLKEINRIRREEECQPLTLDPKLSREAMNIANIRYHTPPSLPLKPGKYHYDLMEVFQINHFPEIPDYIHPFVIKKYYSSIGIGVFYPLKYGLRGNYFLVTLVCRQ